MASDDARLWTSRSGLQEVQYRTDANLAARQAIYAYQRPRLDLPGLTLAMHMLYHVPDPQAAVRELRRITGPGGQVLVADFTAELVVPGPQPVTDYLRSMIVTQDRPDAERLVAAAASRIVADPGAPFRVRTHSGCLVCS